MDNIKAIKFMPRRLHEEMQAIENALKAKVITKKDHGEQIARLDAILKEVSNSSSPFAPAMKEQIVPLYWQIEEAWIQSEVIQIHNEAASLQHAIKSGKVTAGAVTQLAGRIGAFRQQYQPGRECLNLLRGADRVIQLANSVLNNDLPVELPELEAPVPTEAIDGYVLGEMEELMDLAGLVYNGKKTEARTRFAALPESVKKRFLSIMQQLGATPFEDWMATCQVFLMLGHESVGMDHGLPRPEEVDDFFMGLAHVLKEEQAEPSIASLSGRVSIVGG